jgi:hypothetical protein
VFNCKYCVGRVLWVGFMLCCIREIRLSARQLGILRLDNEDHTLLPPEPVTERYDVTTSLAPHNRLPCCS